MKDVIKNLLDQQVVMAKQIADQQQLFNQQISAQNQQMEQQQQALSQIISQIKEIGIKPGKQHPYSSSLAEKGDESPNFLLVSDNDSAKKNIDTEIPHRSPMLFNPRIEFPQFDGTNPRGWVKKCSKYFNLCKTPSQQKVELASLDMIGKAETWYNGYSLGRQHVIWEDFVVDVCARFRDELGSQVVQDFN